MATRKFVYGVLENAVIDVVEGLGFTFPDLKTGEQTVTSAGSAEQLNGGDSLEIPYGAQITIRALGSNNELVYVGAEGVSDEDGYPLENGETISLQMDDVSNVWVDVDTDGEGVRWIVEQQT